ncbi:P-loop containing nucleoside triphosphate hydrolase protein [Syncephalis plumigaleata]|nr:P-loop containing nucleoside triphosphate hydrolase protein [Syncephalis plumigaleata]
MCAIINHSIIAVYGASGVGKTTLLRHLPLDMTLSPDRSISSASGYYRHLQWVEGRPLVTSIMDTTTNHAENAADGNGNGNDGNDISEMSQIPSAGILLVYDVTSRQSFLELQRYYTAICRLSSRYKIPIVLIGNKADDADRRQVSTEEGMRQASIWDCPFWETSTETIGGEQVINAAISMLTEMMEDTTLQWQRKFWSSTCLINHTIEATKKRSLRKRIWSAMKTLQ